MIFNTTKNIVIAEKYYVAKSFLVRGRGMIHRKFDAFDAMVFYKCKSIHTLFMRMTLDVIFFNKDNKVCDIKYSIKPWIFFIKGKNNPDSVIEMQGNSIKKNTIEIGDILNIS